MPAPSERSTAFSTFSTVFWFAAIGCESRISSSTPPGRWRESGSVPVPGSSPTGIQFLGTTPTLNAEQHLEETLSSVLDQGYPDLRYGVVDGGSRDGTVSIMKRYTERLDFTESAPDRGQTEAIGKGFSRLLKEEAREGLTRIMFWLNSDDLLLPGSLQFVAGYFRSHPEIDVVYGHRIIIDSRGREIGRWILPRHNRKALRWVDYVPQETLFWRERAWNEVGGLDPDFQFAMDWDLLLRFQDKGHRIVRLPYFLGCFRFHSKQKTQAHLSAVEAGNPDPSQQEFGRIRSRNARSGLENEMITRFGLQVKILGSLHARLLALGVRV